MNSEADVVSLTKALEKIVPAEADLSRFDEVECLASMRDIGMFLSSIRRHGQQPLDVLPSAEPVLRELGVRTNMVPRETLNHYVVWNPEGSRERLYTGDPMESILMKSIRTTLPRLGTSIEICRQLHEVDIRDARAAELLGELAENLGPFASSMAVVLRDVTPIFFAQSMRPFFDDVTVGDRDYRGLAAAHMPLALVDLALWSSDHPDTQYEQFWRPSVEYVVPHLRDDFDDWKQRPSLVSRAAAAVEDDSAPRNALGDALAALAESLGTLA
ncbi:MAG: monodechloroaminopyrrolnitrin synthase PrnB family protein, partial [Stackebrandtia sp.]